MPRRSLQCAWPICVADLLGDELGWSPERRRQEVASYRAAIEYERSAAGVHESGATPDAEGFVHEVRPTGLGGLRSHSEAGKILIESRSHAWERREDGS